MNHCEILQALLEKFKAEGNEAAAEGIRQAMTAAGCTVTTQGGGNGSGGHD